MFLLDATAVLLQMLVYRNGVFNAVTIIGSVSIALDHFQSSLFLHSVFLHFVFLHHPLFGHLMLVEDRNVASSLSLESHKLLAHV